MVSLLYMYGILMLFMGVMTALDKWEERRRYLDPEAYNQRVLEWATTKNLEDIPAQLDWEEFEGYVDRQLDQHQNPWGKIDTDQILAQMQKLADEDFRRQRQLEEDSLEEEPFYRDDSPPESKTWTPTCPRCHGPTELMYPIGLGEVYNTRSGETRIASGVMIQCEICEWKGASRDSYYNVPCDHAWERIMTDGSGAVQYICHRCGDSRSTDPDGNPFANPFARAGMYAPEDSPFPPFKTEKIYR